MTKAVPPTTKYLDSLVEQYLSSQSSGLGFAMGYATPSFEGIYVKGNVANQFKQDLGLSEDTYFEISFTILIQNDGMSLNCQSSP